MNDKPDIPRILYVDFPAGSDNHLRNLAGIRRYASARGWGVMTLQREETTPAAVKAICAGANDAPPPIGCVVEASGGHHNILPPRLFGNVPIVYLDPPKPLPWRGVEAVTCDHAAVAKAAFEELADAMPPCFAVVASDSGLPWNKERIAAFGTLCTAGGRELRVFPVRSGERPERRISRLSKWLAALPRRSAVFAVNDATALVVAEAALSIPRHIPKELVVLGVDGEAGAEDRETFRAFGERPGLSLTQNFILGDERFFSPETDTANGGGVFLNYRAARGGVVHDGSSRKFTVLESSGSVKENTILANSTSWYRLVISINLDTRKYSCAFYDLGTTHPTLDTPTPETAAFSRSGVGIVNEAVTSISAIGLDCYSPHGGSDPSSLDLSQAGQFDNVRVSHNGVECYVNDFAKRRSRALFGTATATYAADCLVTNTVWTETYAAGVSFYKAAVNNKNISQPVGIDGWRRLNSDLPVTPTVYSDSGNYTMQFGDYTKTGVGATTLGQTLTTGKVRASVDVRATGIAGSGTGQSISMILGSDELYSANYSQFGANNGWFAIGGIVGTQQSVDGATYRRPAYKTSSGWVYPSGENEWVRQGTWLRFTVEADLDAGTYSFTIRDQGTTHPGGDAADGETVYYSKSGIASVKAVTSISSIALTAYNSSVMYDNIKVWHRPTGASAETLVYDNRFTTRTIYYQSLREGRLVGTIMNEPVGLDGWTRANTGVMKVVVRADDANQALTFGNGKDTLAYAVHDIGKLYRGGKMTTQVDVCPPGGWLGGNRITLFWLGGDRFHEGNLKDGAGFYQHAATMFGFHDVAGAMGTGAVYTNVTLCVYNGDGAGAGSYVDSSLIIDPTHWYRFVSTTLLEEGKSDIAVYDMGTTHPTLATATPAVPVETFTGVNFRQAAAKIGGVSSLCISGMGTLDNTLDMSAGVFWDNIRIDHRKDGFMMIVR